MTGFGRGRYTDEGKDILVEIKSVNHRYSDIFTKLPRTLSFLEDKIRDLISKRIYRGKIDVFISYEDHSEKAREVLLDEHLTMAYVNAVEKIKEKFNLADDISVSLISRFPDVLRVEKCEENEEEIWNMVKEALEAALDSLIKMREEEGQKLKLSLLEKASYFEKLLDEVKNRAPEVVKEYKAKLELRISDLLEQKIIDENRLAAEVALFADRCSIDEEIVRLESHISQLRNILNEGEAVGRKLDFLVQELNREVNTIGSKANDLFITKNVVEMKSELEKIREQIQNIE